MNSPPSNESEHKGPLVFLYDIEGTDVYTGFDLGFKSIKIVQDKP